MKSCTHCNASFEITDADRAFYTRLDLPEPTFCPPCRKQRRLAWRNDMSLVSRACNLCSQPIISIYSKENPFPVYCRACWWSDKWSAKDYAMDYDFSKSFFEQFKELQNRVPILALANDDGIASTNCAYTHDFALGKNCYMTFIAWHVEDCLYNNYVLHGKSIVDSLNCMGGCEHLYETVCTEKCYGCRNVYYCFESVDCTFCYDCLGCTNCFLCTGLRQKKYCFKNKQYSKEEYEKKVAEYRINTHEGVRRAKKELQELMLTQPRRPSYMRSCEECTGDMVINGKNAKNCFNVQRPRDCNWIDNSDTPTGCYDLSVGGELESCYEGLTPDHSYQSFFSIFSWKNREVAYVDGVHSSKNVFGCCGLKKAEYCILNKQYSEEGYRTMVKKIRAQMDELPYVDKNRVEYRFGEFFPAELSYFGYNKSVAQEYFPLEKAVATNHGFRWEEETPQVQGAATKKAGDLPETIEEVDDSILKEIIECETCQKKYRLILQELKFYRTQSIPLPRKCFPCRHKERFDIRNTYDLWHRQCMCEQTEHDHAGRCKNEFETTYAPERPEIIYCESCYKKEIY